MGQKNRHKKIKMETIGTQKDEKGVNNVRARCKHQKSKKVVRKAKKEIIGLKKIGERKYNENSEVGKMRIKFNERNFEGEENSRKVVVGNLGEENLDGKKVYLEFEKPSGAKYTTEFLFPNEQGEIEYKLPYGLLDESGVLKCQGVIIGNGYTKRSEVEATFVCCSIKATEELVDKKGVLGLLGILKNDGDGTQALFDDGEYKNLEFVKVVQELPTKNISTQTIYLKKQADLELKEYKLVPSGANGIVVWRFIDDSNDMWFTGSKPTTKVTKEYVLSKLKNEQGEALDTELFDFWGTGLETGGDDDGKLMNLRATSSQYPNKYFYTIYGAEYSDANITFKCKYPIESVIIKYASQTHKNRATIYSNYSGGNEVEGVDIDDTTKEYTINNNRFCIANTSGETYLYIEYIQINYSEKSAYDEYLYVNGRWEMIGTTQVDLSNYYTKAQVDELLANIKVEPNVQVDLMKQVTYDELVELRNNGKLVAGQQYRIIDYDCSTTQWNTASGMHPFDIIVTADDERTLNENARACLSARDNNYFRQKFVEQAVVGAKFKDGITYQNIDTHYFIGIDYNSYDLNDENVNGGANVGREDYIAEIGYAENNDGIEVPVFWKNDPAYEEDGIDYQDTYYYVGQEEKDGVIYDKWQKIDNSDLFWNGNAKVYILTNVVVDAILEETEPVYIDNNLHTWELKYSLDNDTKKFMWACDGFKIYTDDQCWLTYIGEVEIRGEKYYAWENKSEFNETAYLLSKTLDLKIDDQLDYYDYELDEFENEYSTICSNIENANFGVQKGKGVIYYMKDDKGNECWYDFKNIIFYMEDNFNMQTEGVFYTFNELGQLKDLSLSKEDINECVDNQINPYIEDGIYTLNFNVFNGYAFYSIKIESGSFCNYYYGWNSSNSIGQGFVYNYVGDAVQHCLFGQNVSWNTFVANIYNQEFPSGTNNEYFKENYEKPESNDIINKLKKINDLPNLSTIPSYYATRNEFVTSLYINVGTIGSNSFKDCHNLSQVYLDYNVVTIGEYAFANCPNLKNLYISFTKRKVFGEGAFSKTGIDGTKTHIMNLYIQDEKDYLWQSNHQGWGSGLQPSKVYKEDTKGQYKEVKTLKATDANVTKVNPNSFYKWTSIENFELSSYVVEIGERAFAYCEIKDFVFEKSVKNIGEEAFYYTTIENVYYKGTLEDWITTNYGDGDANPMSKAKHIYIYNENQEFVEVNDIIIPNTIKEIPTYAFYNNDVITSVVMPDSVETLNIKSFYSCGNLKNVKLSKSITTIPEFCFANSNLEYFELPNNITKIEQFAFSSNSKSMFIKIPNSVSEIGTHCFGYGYNIICCEANSQPDGWNSQWAGASINSAVYWGVNENNFIEIDNNKYYIENEEAKIISYENKSEQINIPETINVNGVNYNVTKIGKLSFANTILSEVSIPNFINEIDEKTFYKNSNIKKANLSNINTIPKEMFYMASNLEEVILGNNIDRIENYAFYYCMIKNIDIPESVTYIGEWAFARNKFKNVNTKNAVVVYNAFYVNELNKLTIPYNIQYDNSYFWAKSINILDLGGHPNTIISKVALQYEIGKTIKTLIIRRKDKVVSYVNYLNGYMLDINSNAKIYVPDELLEQYKVATNWVEIANQIYPLSEYVEE